MKQFELDILANTFKRCFGLAYCVTSDIRGWQQELAKQTGFRQQFIADNEGEIKRFAQVRTTILNPIH